jgi:polyisoprenoid-binding protein YceI
MKKFIFITCIAFLSSAFSIVYLWNIDEENCKVNWELSGTHQGTFSKPKAVIIFDKDKLAESKIKATIDVSTLKAGDEKLEKHLLSSDYFDAEKFPTITFTSGEIKSTETGFLTEGNLTMKDSTKKVSLQFSFIENSTSIFTGTMVINESDFGVMKSKKPGSDKTTIHIEVPVSK